MKTCVFGLPRSRTAWLAAWLGAEHEALSRVASLDELPDHISETATIFAPALAARFPEARYLFVFRDPAESARSCVAAGLPVEGLPLLIDGLHAACAIARHGLAVDYAAIDEHLPEIWAHLRDGDMADPPGHIEADCAALIAATDWNKTNALLRDCGIAINKES